MRDRVRDWLGMLWVVLGLTLRADRRTTVVVALLLLGQSGIVAATALSQRWLVDSAVAHVGWGVAGAVALGAAAFGFQAAGNRVQQNMLLYLNGRVNIELSAHIQGTVAGIPTITHLDRPDYLNRLNRLRSNSGALAGLFWSVYGTLAATAGLLLTIVLLASVTPLLSALALLVLPPILASRWADRRVERARDESAEWRRHEQALHGICVTPASAKEVVVTGTGEVLLSRADDYWNRALRQEARARLRALAVLAAGWLVYAAGFAAAIALAANRARDGQASLGDATMVIVLGVQLQAQLRGALTSFTDMTTAGTAIEHYWWLQRYAHDRRRPGSAAPATLTTGLTLDGVCFRYPGAEQDTLHDLHLRLPAGATVALVGTNGAGKSTLVKLLTGLEEPTAGRILVDDVPLDSIARAAWHGRLSGVFQDFVRLLLRTSDMIGVGYLPRLHDRTVLAEAADRGGAADTVAQLPQGLDTPLGKVFGGTELSAGQWQRLAVSRALMPEVVADRDDTVAPPLCVVLDEPTAALDPPAEHEVFRRFVAQARATTARGGVTVLVSHRFTTARMADLIVVLDAGRIAETGTHAELMAADAGYAHLYRLQEKAYLG
jgi:ATP-binding cassette subfamily B protein